MNAEYFENPLFNTFRKGSILFNDLFGFSIRMTFPKLLITHQ